MFLINADENGSVVVPGCATEARSAAITADMRRGDISSRSYSSVYIYIGKERAHAL